MITYKNYRTNQVISEKDYLKLHHSKRMEFSKVYGEKVTHTISYDNNNNIELFNTLTSPFNVSGSSIFDTTSESSSSFDFGGGDFGGGGAGSDF